MSDDSINPDKLDQLDDRLGSGTNEKNNNNPDQEENKSEERELETDETERQYEIQYPVVDEPSQANWEGINVYLQQEVYEEFKEPFFIKLKLDNREFLDYLNRELQQATVEVGMNHRNEVVKRAEEIHTSDEETEWKPFTIYLTGQTLEEFTDPFFLRLKLDYELHKEDYDRRELQQAVLSVAMEHRDEVVNQAHTVHKELTTDK